MIINRALRRLRDSWIYGCFVIFLASVFYQVIRECRYFSENSQAGDVKVPIILWWTPFAGKEGELRSCSQSQCYFTANRGVLIDSYTKAILFYGSGFKVTDLPIPKEPSVQWILLHEESPKNNLILTHKPLITLFNQSATFKRSSHFALTSLHLNSLNELTSKKYYVPLKTKNELLPELSLVLYIQSNCDTMSERDMYVQELMKYINIDSYGTCLNNRKLPQNLANSLEDMKKEEFLHFVARYKFTLSFENAICDDYITEKLWRPLSVGSVPIYFGSTTVRDWLPNNNSAILATDFKSPESLASYLYHLNINDDLYMSYLQHKSEGIISNENLVNEMNNRQWSEEDFIEKFECFICDNLNHKDAPYFVHDDHLNCPPPVSPVTLTLNYSSWWLMHWRDSKVEAKVLRELIDEKRNFTPEKFYEMVFMQSKNVEYIT